MNSDGCSSSGDSSDPLISICIPTYQGGRYLAATLKSALSQDAEDFEVVVLDNASTDDTCSILGQFDDQRLRVVRNEEVVDLPTNWRRAVQSSRGRYVKVLCADDLIHHTAIRVQADLLDERPEVSLVASRRALIDHDGRVLANNLGLRGVLGPRGGRRIARRTVLGGGINPVGEPAAVMFRRRDYEAIGGWDGSLVYPMDLDLWVRLMQRGTFFGQSEELAAFRVSPTALSAAHSTQQYQEIKLLLTQITSDRSWGLNNAERIFGAVMHRLTWEAWPLRQRRMQPGDPWSG